MKKNIWVHTLVKNEERYLWYAVMSVINHVDRVLLWDTGSTDKTIEIIKEIQKIKGNKIDFKEVGSVDPEKFTQVRQQMLDQTKSDWFLVVDGDEVWWDSSIKKVIQAIQNEGDKLEMIVSPYYNVIGDIYHYQDKEAGEYQIDDKKGHFNIRAINRKIPGLHLEKPHGQQGFYDGNRELIQNRPKNSKKFIDAPYLHFTNMIRSSSRIFDKNVPKRSLKYKYEIGNKFPENFKYPEAFYLTGPTFVPSPWNRVNSRYIARAKIETLFKKIKRKILPSTRVGY